MNDLKDPNVMVATASMFEQLSGQKGKFTNAVAMFDHSEPLSAVMDWARGFCERAGRELIRVEINYNSRR